ncbi:Protease Do-like 10 [Durusdinium trenchii]|uniref:Mitochondrial n=1 Tax=Durusdinium trenchii TaxID=1381693 RepID=A0ABP0H7A8_9DINO
MLQKCLPNVPETRQKTGNEMQLLEPRVEELKQKARRTDLLESCPPRRSRAEKRHMDASGAPHAAGGRSVELSAVRRCVVKVPVEFGVFVRSSQPNWTSPWQRRPQRAGSGSGFCINASRRQILTNAHVVGDAVTVRVRRYGHAARYPAKVLCISPQVDLALLEVPAEAFWEAPPALSSVELSEEVPELDSDVLTVGYPLGGENICVTRGVVSRIDLMDYTFSPVGGERQLVMQVDAAINPGNSGGPVLDASGKAVGVAFAKLQSSANIGYVIPGSVVRYFLRGVARCRSPVLCALGVRLQPARSAALRAWHGLDGGTLQTKPPGASDPQETEDGALVVDVAPLSAAAQAGLKAGDVLLAIDDVPVAEDGSIPFRDAERIGFDFLVSRRVTGDLFSGLGSCGTPCEGVEIGGRGAPRATLSAKGIHKTLLRIYREWEGDFSAVQLHFPLHHYEKALQVHVSAKPLPQLVPRRAGVDCVPSYLVVGGLVFMPLTLPWLLARFSEAVLPGAFLERTTLDMHNVLRV